MLNALVCWQGLMELTCLIIPTTTFNHISILINTLNKDPHHHQ